MSSTPESPQPAKAPAQTGAAPRPGAGEPRPGSADERGVVKKTTDNVKRLTLVLLGAFAALFAVFNARQVEVRWIFGDPIQTPLILVIAVCLAVGFAGGWLVAKRRTSANSK